MADNDVIPIIVSIITGLFAIILALISLYERRADKRAELHRKERETELEKIKEESSRHIKEISDEIAEQYRQRVQDLENEVKQLKERVACLEKELDAAYKEITRLKALPRGTRRNAE